MLKMDEISWLAFGNLLQIIKFEFFIRFIIRFLMEWILPETFFSF